MTGTKSNINRAAGVSLAFGAFCILLVVIGGLAHRFELIHFRTGLNLLGWAAWLAPICMGLAIVTFIMSYLKGAKPAAYIGALLGLLMALAVYVPHQMFRQRAASVPRIHDITTDTENPPEFVSVRELRGSTANSVDYQGPVIANQQREAYPDIAPLVLSVGPEEAFDMALAKAQSLGWEIVEASPEQGRIEATDTTLIFGFKDDVVIRLTELEEGQTKVDVRSVSRVGLSDVGANADRIRKFLSSLKQ